MDGGEDIIEDDYDSFDELFTQHFTNQNLSAEDALEIAPDSRQRTRSNPPSAGIKKPTGAAKRFILPPSETYPLSPPPTKDDLLPWAQRYPPLNLEELAVHKRKVSDVERWLIDAFSEGSNKKLLVLRGPAGSGKTTTISLLSNKLKFNILEWKSPSVSEFTTKQYMSLGAQFDEFVSRSHKFRGLNLDEVVQSHHDQRIILIEEFPTLSGRAVSQLAAFRLTIQRHISLTLPEMSEATKKTYLKQTGAPIVMIVSETFAGSELPLSENLTLHRLLGREICNHASTTIIDFNSVAPTFLSKALSLVLEKDARRSGIDKTPGAAVLKAISESGDIRNALASLEFICLEGNSLNKRTNRTLKSKKKRRKPDAPTDSERETLQIIAEREINIGLFHAVGKVIYNKRDDPIPPTKHLQLPSPPKHLQHFDRPRISQVSVNELADETGTDKQTFISALHENYVLSCNSPSFTECLDGCITALSDSDILCADQASRNRHRGGFGIGMVNPGANVDLLRQEDISYQVATRGLLFALPYPVRRQSSSNRKFMDDSHKIFPPPTIHLSHKKQDVQCLLDSCASVLLHASNRSSIDFIPELSNPTQGKSRLTKAGEPKNTSVSTASMLSRSELLLHQLPYMSTFLPDTAILRDIRKITAFSRIGAPSEAEGQEMSIPRKCEGSSLLRSQGIGYRNNSLSLGPGDSLIANGEYDKLVLSDDDIVDDF